MAHELAPGAYQRVLPLLDGAPFRYSALVLRATAAGACPGRIWVDDGDHPAAALMWDQGGYYFLLGDADDTRFNGALARLIAAEVAPQAVARGPAAFKGDHSPDDWAGRVPAIFGAASLVERERVCLTLEPSRTGPWAARVPDDYQLRQIDAALLAGLDPPGRAALTEEIASSWRSLDAFLDRGFGCCAVRGAELVGWCLAEYVAGRETGVSVETGEAYRGRGFATLTAAAFVDQCLARGMALYWDAWRSNAPSVAVARKVGFSELLAYTVHLGRFA